MKLHFVNFNSNYYNKYEFFLWIFIAMAVRIVFPDCGEHNNYGETACIFLDDNTSEDVFSVTYT